VVISVCPPRSQARLAELRSQLTEWVSSAALAELVAMTDAATVITGSLRERLAALEEFSAAWDYRGRAHAAQVATASQDAGAAARWLIEGDFTPEQDGRIRELAANLGLVNAQAPSRSSFDYVLVLGGARLSNLLRPQYAAELIRDKQVKAGELVLLGGARPVMDSERDATDTYAPGAQTEFDLMNMGGGRSFGLDLARAEQEVHNDEQANASWRIWSFDAASSELQVPVVSMAAPSREPNLRRANSADSYAFFASHLDPQLGRSCLLVTSQIYVPYQHLEAVRNLALPFDLELETVGFPPSWHSELQGMQTGANYLQEIRSTILSARRLYEQYLAS
jgi:hypothetical protein